MGKLCRGLVLVLNKKKKALLVLISFSFIKNKNKKKKQIKKNKTKGDASSLTCFTATHHVIGTTTYTVTIYPEINTKVWRADKVKVEKEPSARFWTTFQLRGLQDLRMKLNL